ncbi:MAG: hypothetical protein CM15mP120_04990 [Pseudomonadota bacterium]|nr:MAG: hypothetical protein CM15mP120_04990 [Pseudomonadota bacterium]
MSWRRVRVLRQARSRRLLPGHSTRAAVWGKQQHRQDKQDQPNTSYGAHDTVVLVDALINAKEGLRR